MGNSLFDQLKKSGLVSDKQVRQVKQSKYQDQKQQKGKKSAPINERQQHAQQMQAEKLDRDRQLNQQLKEEAERKAIAAQIKQLIEAHHIENRDGEIAYHFTDGSKIKRIHINAAVHKELCDGRLVIVKLGNRYEMVPSDIAEKIKERDASRVINYARNEEAAMDDDDPYAAYKVPDDLMW